MPFFGRSWRRRPNSVPVVDDEVPILLFAGRDVEFDGQLHLDHRATAHTAATSDNCGRNLRLGKTLPGDFDTAVRERVVQAAAHSSVTNASDSLFSVMISSMIGVPEQI